MNEIVELAPSGESPFSHRVELTDDGRLVLMWGPSGDYRVRTFTSEETVNLLRFLQKHSSEIEHVG